MTINLIVDYLNCQNTRILFLCVYISFYITSTMSTLMCIWQIVFLFIICQFTTTCTPALGPIKRPSLLIPSSAGINVKTWIFSWDDSFMNVNVEHQCRSLNCFSFYLWMLPHEDILTIYDICRLSVWLLTFSLNEF